MGLTQCRPQKSAAHISRLQSKLARKRCRNGLVAWPCGRCVARKHSANSAMKPAASPMLRVSVMLNQIRERVCSKHYILRTEHAHVQLVRLFVQCHGLRPRLTWGCRKSSFSGHVGQGDGFGDSSWRRLSVESGRPPWAAVGWRQTTTNLCSRRLAKIECEMPTVV
jgi:hypothetical protein